jgi:LysR family transcriptional regulator, hydrogen peroxide-inducible genes activator
LGLSMKWAPHPFTLRQLQYVVAVAETLSFRRAAERCHVSQPALSAQVAQAEEALGAPVFERNRQRVLLTVAGQALVDRAKQMLVCADDLLNLSERTRDPLAGTLRIGVIPTVSPYLLPSVTPVLRAKCTRLTVAWLEEKTDTQLLALERGEIEGALLALSEGVRDVEREVIAEDAFVLVAAPDHALAQKASPVALGELRGAEVMLLDDGHCFREQALEVCGTARARESAFRATSLSTLVQMVAGGAGVTLLPTLAVPIETRRADVCVRPFARPPRRTLALVWRKRSPYEAALRVVAECLRAAYPKAIAAYGTRPKRSRK